jgi:hypothetical protein
VAAVSIPISEAQRISVRTQSTIRNRGRETGIALLISIFILLLISVVAIALIVASGTESSLAGNYRSATGVYYAALAGLEEARGRLLPKNANSFKNTAPGFLPSPGIPLAMGSASYVLNPGPTENLANILTIYPDTQYVGEFGVAPSNVKTTASIWNSAPLNALNVPGPLYKWVRINAVSEQSLNLDTYPYDGTKDPTPLYYDGAHLTDNSSVGPQVLEITALAVLPNGSQKILQYLAAPVPMVLPNFPAALTFAGNPVNRDPAYLLNYGAPDSTTWYVNGTDSFRYSLSDIPSWSCTPSAPTVYAIGYTNTLDASYSYIRCCKVLAHPNNYIGPGAPGTNPSVHVVSMPANLQTPTDYNNLVQNITQNADVIITPTGGPPPPPVNAATLSANTTGMSSSNPLTVVIQGDLDLNGWHDQGYGLLLVTGTLNYDPDASWYGIVMVIGKGLVTGSRSGTGEFDGATLVVQTVNPSTGAPLGFLGGAYMQFADNMGGLGFYYSSCWINNSIPSSAYKILSFHEISQ